MFSIITTNNIGCKGCYKDGVNEYLVPLGNSVVMAERIIELIRNLKDKMHAGSFTYKIRERIFTKHGNRKIVRVV